MRRDLTWQHSCLKTSILITSDETQHIPRGTTYYIARSEITRELSHQQYEISQSLSQLSSL